MADSPTYLTEDDVRADMVLWLASNADEIDPPTFERSNLHPGALGHPALVLRILRGDHDYLWISTVWLSLTFDLTATNSTDDKQVPRPEIPTYL